MHCMQSTSAILLLALLGAASSQRFPPKKLNDLTTGEKFVSDVHVAAHDFRQSQILKKKAVAGTVRAMIKAKYGVLRDLKEFDDKILNTLVDIVLAKLEAVKVIKLALLNMLSTQINALMDEIQSNDATDLMDSPIFGIIVETMVPLLSGRHEEDAQGTQNTFAPQALQFDDWSPEKLGTATSDQEEPRKFSTLK